MNFRRHWLVGLLLLGAIHTEAAASVAVSGTFQASRACEAYQSKNQLTNPDNFHLKPGQLYNVVEANRRQHPDWYRVQVRAAEPSRRWVARTCGTFILAPEDMMPTAPPTAAACHTPGRADAYVLALSWQPAFCETHREKSECKIGGGDSFQAQHFTLHGLWPNQALCGRGYDYCGGVKHSAFCDYPTLDLSTVLRTELDIAMPSAAAGSCLQRHQWFKHGTCQTFWHVNDYFALALDLLGQFNASGMAKFMASNLGRVVSEKTFIEALDGALGAGAHDRVTLRCQENNLLVEVYVALPATLRAGDQLVDLLPQVESRFHSNCRRGRFKVDPIGF